MQGELVDLSDRQLVELALAELNQLIGIDGVPELDFVCRWKNAMPQYHVGHLDRVEAIETELDSFPTLAVAGNAYRGVGIPICIRSGITAAAEIAESLLNN
jgi:oxygen-dependent protoporphyrinogen oxidase